MKTFSLRKEDVTHRWFVRSEEHTSELQSRSDLVCRLLLEKKKKTRCRRRTPKTHTPLLPPTSDRVCALELQQRNIVLIPSRTAADDVRPYRSRPRSRPQYA